MVSQSKQRSYKISKWFQAERRPCFSHSIVHKKNKTCPNKMTGTRFPVMPKGTNGSTSFQTLAPLVSRERREERRNAKVSKIKGRQRLQEARTRAPIGSCTPYYAHAFCDTFDSCALCVFPAPEMRIMREFKKKFICSGLVVSSLAQKQVSKNLKQRPWKKVCTECSPVVVL